MTNTEPIRWVALRGRSGDYQVISGPASRLESTDVPEQQRLGYETVAIVDTEQEAWRWVEVHRSRRP